jgi:hypothetical protein
MNHSPVPVPVVGEEEPGDQDESAEGMNTYGPTTAMSYQVMASS